MASHEQVTLLVSQAREGDPKAVEKLIPIVYAELRVIAARFIRRERPNHTLQPTALVHEAYMRLLNQPHLTWKDRAHFLAIAARQMRRILIDHARAKYADKRAGDIVRITLDEHVAASDGRDVELLTLDRALDNLAEKDPRAAHLVELRYFGGMTIEETAEALGISTATVEREWAAARAWLKLKVRGECKQ